VWITVALKRGKGVFYNLSFLLFDYDARRQRWEKRNRGGKASFLIALAEGGGFRSPEERREKKSPRERKSERVLYGYYSQVERGDGGVTNKRRVKRLLSTILAVAAGLRGLPKRGRRVSCHWESYRCVRGGERDYPGGRKESTKRIEEDERRDPYSSVKFLTGRMCKKEEGGSPPSTEKKRKKAENLLSRLKGLASIPREDGLLP